MIRYEAFHNECKVQMRTFLITSLSNDIPESLKDIIYDRMDNYAEAFSRTIWKAKNDFDMVMFGCFRDTIYAIGGYVNALIDCNYMKSGSNLVIIDNLYRLCELVD